MASVTKTQTKSNLLKLSTRLSSTEKPTVTEVENDDNKNEVKVYGKYREDEPYTIKIVWKNVIAFLIIHLGALYGTYLMFFEAKFLTNIWALAIANIGALGVTMGAHRLYTHRTFKANKWIRLALVTCQTIAGQNCLWVWIRDHRQHHKYSDTDGDPHNASRGFFFSHMGWLMIRKHPEVIKKGPTIDMSDINADPFVMFQKKYYYPLFILISVVFPVAVPILLWEETLRSSFFICFVARLVVTLNFTWLVNSAAHIYGTKPFSKNMLPSENAFVSFFGLGEGWHNYHHTFPWDYKAAEFGQRFNITTSVIDYCYKKGWVYDLKCASEELVRKHALSRGDGTHYIYGRMQENTKINNN